MPWWGSSKKEKASGFIDDMDEEQEEALYDLKDIIENQELTQDPRFNDEYLLRFLRNNNFNVKKTYTMFEEFIQWREESKADRAMVIYRFPELPQLKIHYEHGYHMTDYEGRPVWIDRPCAADIDACFHLVTPDMMMKYYISEYERLIHFKFPACSAAQGKNVDSTFSIVDWSGFKMSLLNKKGREFVKIASTLGQNYYPEIMWQMYVINTPILFKAAWVVIKPFLNEKSRNRIKLLGGKYQKELFKIVDPDNVPTVVGGNCTCEDKGGNWFQACPGPWDEHPGDEFGEAALKELEENTSDEAQQRLLAEGMAKIGKNVEQEEGLDELEYDQVTQTN